MNESHRISNASSHVLSNGVNAIMLSTDRTILDADSPARARMEEYAAVLGKLSIIVFSRRAPFYAPTVGVPLSIYPTNSFSRVSYLHDAERIGRTIGGADVVTAQDPFETGLAGLRIAQALGVPLHVQVHTNFLAPGFLAAHWPLNWVRTMIAGFVVRRAARIRTVSEKIKKALEKHYPRLHAPISVLPIFVDLQKYRNIARTRHPKFKTALLIVSRLEPEKRVALAVRALKKARDAGFEAGLTIVGSGSEEGTLKREAGRLGISAWVEFAGFQNNLIPYYAVADVLLYPGAPYEGFGMAIIEALAAGVPVLAEDVGIARQAGAEIAEGDFGEALMSLLKKEPQRATLLYQPYQSKEEYLRKFKEDLTISSTHG